MSGSGILIFLKACGATSGLFSLPARGSYGQICRRRMPSSIEESIGAFGLGGRATWPAGEGCGRGPGAGGSRRTPLLLHLPSLPRGRPTVPGGRCRAWRSSRRIHRFAQTQDLKAGKSWQPRQVTDVSAAAVEADLHMAQQVQSCPRRKPALSLHTGPRTAFYPPCCSSLKHKHSEQHQAKEQFFDSWFRMRFFCRACRALRLQAGSKRCGHKKQKHLPYELLRFAEYSRWHTRHQPPGRQSGETLGEP